MNEKKKIGYRNVLKQKDYMKMTIAALINRFGDSIDFIAFSWIVYELTGNAVWSAVIFGANNLPGVFVTPFAGVWVEGRNKKRIMIVTDLIRAACVALIATFYLLGMLQPWMLLLSTLTISIAEAFRNPAGTALTPRVLTRDCYEYGMSLKSALSQTMQLVGMGAGAGIIAVLGAAGAVYIDMATFLASALIILFVNTKEEKTEKKRFEQKEYVGRLYEGFSYMKKKSILCFMIGYCVFMNMLVVPLNSLQAPLAEEVLGGGPEILSILGVCLTLGMILGTTVFPALQKRVSEKMLLFSSVLSLAVLYLGLILCQPLYASQWFMYSWVILLCTLFGVVFSQGTSLASVALVKHVEESYLARVGGIASALSVASAPITSFLISAVIGFTGTKWMFGMMGVLALLGGAFILGSKVLDEGKDAENDVPGGETVLTN